MKVLMLVLLAFTLTQGGVLKNYGRQCAHQSGISRSALLSIENLKAPSSDDEAYKNFIFCLLKKMGILTNDGELRSDTEGVEKWMAVDEAKDAVEEIKRLCGTQKARNYTDTADLVYRCILDNNL